MFGRLKLLALPEGLWCQCQCSCGKLATIRRYALTSGHTRSCGCLNKEQVVAIGHANKTHGMRHTKIYGIWTDMMTRCYNSNRPCYKNYGGRGIFVSTRWHDFAKFYADMGEPPTPKHTLDRVENDGSYSADNCRWATWREQAANRRSTIWVIVDGAKVALRDACRRCGVNHSTVRNYIVRVGFTPQNALDIVVSKKNNLTSPPHRGV